MGRKTIEYSTRPNPPAYYASTRMTRIEGGIRWLNNVRVNSDDLEELHDMLTQARAAIEALEREFDVLSVNARTRLGIYLPIDPLTTGVKGVRRWIGEHLRTFNPVDPYILPETGLSHIINDPRELAVFLSTQRMFVPPSSQRS